MTRVAAWISSYGLEPDAVKRRALAGVVIGVTVVLIDHVLRMGS